jgi:hypothetical protein
MSEDKGIEGTHETESPSISEVPSALTNSFEQVVYHSRLVSARYSLSVNGINEGKTHLCWAANCDTLKSLEIQQLA